MKTRTMMTSLKMDKRRNAIEEETYEDDYLSDREIT